MFGGIKNFIIFVSVLIVNYIFMKFVPKFEIWKVSELIAIKDKLIRFPHQRVMKLSKNSTQTLIESILLGDLDTPFKLCDIKSCLDNNPNDFEYFNPPLLNGFTHSIEDCQHRLGALYFISNNDFDGKFKDRKQEFYDSEVAVYVYKTESYQDLIRKYGKTNSGKKIKTEEMVWKVLNDFNNNIKNLFLTAKYIRNLYNVKNKVESSKRTFYNNIIKMIKVCAYYDGIIDNVGIDPNNLLNFIENDENIDKFKSIIDIFDQWFNLITDKKKKNKFFYQSNLFFILHVIKTYNIELNENEIINLLESLTDTRAQAPQRYKIILNTITNEK